jgi:predicted lipoprotein with Yx(FWY)xxD motif
VVGVLALAGCGSSKKAATSTTPTATSSTSTSTTVAPANATVQVATVAGDQILVGANGMTLYLFEKDSGTTSACTGTCAGVWPALTAASPKAGTGVDAAKLSTANGQTANQVVYNGHLLYFFSGDTKPGDVNGTRIASWYPVKPTGDKLVKG